MYWQTTRFRLSLTRPLVMGIVNVTPDSFSDGGRHGTPAQAMAWCDQLVGEGADILDIGGESTRPGGRAPDLDEELRRVLPVVRHAVALGRPVSVDTSRPEVMAEAIAAGADIVNDVRALRRPGALAVLADAPDTGVCLMHMRGEPETMQQHTAYDDVVHDVALDLGQRMREVVDAGVRIERIALDPGIGFAKTVSACFARSVDHCWSDGHGSPRWDCSPAAPCTIGWVRAWRRRWRRRAWVLLSCASTMWRPPSTR